MSNSIHHESNLIRHAAASTVGTLFSTRARLLGDNIALQDRERQLSYRELEQRANRIANLLTRLGVKHGDRVAILAENCIDYPILLIACAKSGAIAACQNWRLAVPELQHCLNLVEPHVVLVSSRHAATLNQIDCATAIVIELDTELDRRLADIDNSNIQTDIEPEDPLLILYTSGTTGLPKGAVLNHRAEIARNLVVRAEFGISINDTFAAWSPLYHMGAAECTLGTLMSGGKVIIVDGFDVPHLADILAKEQLGWLILMPGMIDRMIDELKSNSIRPAGVKVCGVMADLVPRHQIAEITRLLNAPYCNTFGATETGCPPCSSNLLAIGEVPASLSKQQSPFCEVRLVDDQDNDVPDGSPGELAMRGPTLFSGYWCAPDVNSEDFRGGWFHMGDVFVRNADGTLDFVDRKKYMIKSGGENIYPAEIERVLLADARVSDAAVVRLQDGRWGEIPVAFVARSEPTLSDTELLSRCRDNLAGYKQPKQIHFIELDEFPRSASGKIQRHELEKRLYA